MVSPPDAVAAISIGKRLGLPPRLVTVLEGEGLVNDATALVLLRTAVAAVAGSFSLWQGVGSFAYALVVGIAIEREEVHRSRPGHRTHQLAHHSAAAGERCFPSDGL